MTREKAKIIDAVCITLIACLIVFTTLFVIAVNISYAECADELYAEAFEVGYTEARKYSKLSDELYNEAYEKGYAAAQKDELKRYYNGDAVTDRYIAQHIRIEGTVEPEVIATVLYELEKVPSLVMENFIAEGGKIVINNKNFPSHDLKSETAIGFYCEADKYIEIDGSCAENIKNALLHEIGHYIDYSRYDTYEEDEEGIAAWKIKWSDEEEWMDCFEREKDGFFEFDGNAKYHTSSAVEYFAEAFEWYINDTDMLFTNCHDTAYFVMRYSNG